MYDEVYVPLDAIRDAERAIGTTDPDFGPACERDWGMRVWRLAIKAALAVPRVEKEVSSYRQLGLFSQ